MSNSNVQRVWLIQLFFPAASYSGLFPMLFPFKFLIVISYSLNVLERILQRLAFTSADAKGHSDFKRYFQLEDFENTPVVWSSFIIFNSLYIFFFSSKYFLVFTLISSLMYYLEVFLNFQTFVIVFCYLNYLCQHAASESLSPLPYSGLGYLFLVLE